MSFVEKLYAFLLFIWILGNPMFPGGMLPGGMAGYGPPYWNGGSFAPMRPFTNMYGHPGMMPFNPAMLPVSPYAVPPHISSMYGGPPAPRYICCVYVIMYIHTYICKLALLYRGWSSLYKKGPSI